MSEQIREQISAFLDGELPGSETELLLRRLLRDGQLRESFGRYAAIGESLRGGAPSGLSQRFTGRVNAAIDGEPAALSTQAPTGRPRWWRPFAGAAVAAGVAAVAVLGLQQRAVAPGVRAILPESAAHIADARPQEALSYTVPSTPADAPAALPAARLTNYIFAHSKYSSVLGQENVLSGLLTATDEQDIAVERIKVERAASGGGDPMKGAGDGTP